jgi:peptidoglycan/LPS O-acetylase OafA/YrhL
MTSQFRPEIAGLRAIAVLGVVLFHLKVPGFSGGFVGVDIFFVISGYLITRNIPSDLDAGAFTFANFDIRRTRRIFPALIVTVLLTYVAAALWCSPLMFLDIAKEATHALLSIANIQYWREQHQYFAPNSDELALLHGWSLSREEQFYLAWPLLIVAARKYGVAFSAIAVASLASLVASIVVSRTDASAVFFLGPFRIYEFGCGALILLVEPRVKLGPAAANILSGAGLAGVVASVLVLRSDMPYPAIATLLPCIAAAVVILAGSRTVASRLLVNRPIRGDLLFALSLPLADHLFCALHCRRRRRHGHRHYVSFLTMSGNSEAPADLTGNVGSSRAQVLPITQHSFGGIQESNWRVS